MQNLPNGEYEYIATIRIPLYLIQGFGDTGASTIESIHDGKIVSSDKDDLRLTIKLSGGTEFILTGHDRIFIDDGDDHLTVETLRLNEDIPTPSIVADIAG